MEKQKTKKVSFLLYISFYKAVKHLSKEDKGSLFDAIHQYQLGEELEELNPQVNMAYQFYLNQFELDEVKYQKIVERNKNNGSKGGRPKNPSKTQKTQWDILKPKKAEKEKEKEKEKVTYYRKFKHLSLTFNEFEKLNSFYTKTQIDDVLDKIENYKLNKNYISLYLTCNNWLKKEKSSEKKESVYGTIVKNNLTLADKFKD